MKKILILLFLAFFFSVFTQAALLSQPYIIQFKFIYETSEPVEFVDGKMITCNDKDCSEIFIISQEKIDTLESEIEQLKSITDDPDGMKLLELLSKERELERLKRILNSGQLNCSDKYCTTMVENFVEYRKLILNFSDKTRESNVFEQGSNVYRDFAFGYYEPDKITYDVKVTNSGLIVTNTTFFDSNVLLRILQSLIFLLIVVFVFEGIAVFVFFSLTKSSFSPKLIISIFIATLFSILAVWSLIVIAFIICLILFVLEGFFINFINKNFSLKKSFILSLAINAIILLIMLFSYSLP
jgi:hypothetical protein